MSEDLTQRSEKPSALAESSASFKYTLSELGYLLRTEPNSWIHLAATGLVIAAGVALPISQTDWCLLVFAIAAVWITESINTAIEVFVDEVCPHYNRAAVDQGLGIGCGAHPAR